jgi:hypothetical protein
VIQRLRESLAGTETLEGRAAFLLRAAPAPTPLSTATVQRIGARLHLVGTVEPFRMLSWPMGFLLPMSLALASVLALHRSRGPAPHLGLASTVRAAEVAGVAAEVPPPPLVQLAAAPPHSVGLPVTRVRMKPRAHSAPDEATQLRKILVLAGSPDSAGQALQELADFRQRFPAGSMLREADLAEVRADLILDHRVAAIETLDRLLSQPDPPRATELVLLRGELLAKENRCADALASWSGMNVQSSAQNERLLHGQAACLAKIGRRSESESAYRAYLATFPTGRFADEARVTLSGWDPPVDE